MDRKECDIPNQCELWNKQHAERGGFLENGDLRFIPNETAVKFEYCLCPGSVILEVGAANGRDARYLASKGHKVYAVDFSEVALRQMTELSEIQGLGEKVTPILWDIGTGDLPEGVLPDKIDAFYSRSALHLCDDLLVKLMEKINDRLVNGGLIMIEGKGPNDVKILRSRCVDNNLVVDDEESGHLRRVWTKEYTCFLCGMMKWLIVVLEDHEEKWNGVGASFMRLLAKKCI